MLTTKKCTGNTGNGCNANNHCLSCRTESFRSISGQRCIPINGYYENNLEVAAKCNEGCFACFST